MHMHMCMHILCVHVHSQGCAVSRRARALRHTPSQTQTRLEVAGARAAYKYVATLQRLCTCCRVNSVTECLDTTHKTKLRRSTLMQQAEAEDLTLLVADNRTGYFGVAHQPSHPKPYQARVSRGGKQVHLGYFATAKEAALCASRDRRRGRRWRQSGLQRRRR